MGRLFSKARGSLHGNTVEMLTLGHHFLHLELQAHKARFDAQIASGVDPQQIEDEFEERMRGRVALLPGADDDGADSDSDSDVSLAV